ncbi:MAG: BON domain-containing protein [Acidobacteriota bacterium]|nr:BON domain-containing protein [Acidobacteriota bacterium]
MLTLFLSFDALASNDGKKAKAGKEKTSQTNCSATTDGDILKAVKENLEADSDIKDQMRHLNVSVKNRTVTLEGWLDGKATIAKANTLAKKTKCVKRVSGKLKERGGISCGPGQKPCGDTCIDKGSKCNIVLINQS